MDLVLARKVLLWSFLALLLYFAIDWWVVQPLRGVYLRVEREEGPVVEEPATVEEMEGWKREILERRRSERSV